MHSANSGDYLYGNGKLDSEAAGMMDDGQIISMIADLDKGTLRFWLDGQPHGPGWSSGVKGKLRWSVNMYYRETERKRERERERQSDRQFLVSFWF